MSQEYYSKVNVEILRCCWSQNTRPINLKIWWCGWSTICKTFKHIGKNFSIKLVIKATNIKTIRWKLTQNWTKLDIRTGYVTIFSGIGEERKAIQVLITMLALNLPASLLIYLGIWICVKRENITKNSEYQNLGRSRNLGRCREIRGCAMACKMDKQPAPSCLSMGLSQTTGLSGSS